MCADDVLLRVSVEGLFDADPSEVEEVTTQLRREILALDVERVDQVPVEAAPDGTRAAEVVVLGALVVAVAPALVQGLFTTLVAWLERSKARSIEVTMDGRSIKLTAASRKEIRQLIGSVAGSGDNRSEGRQVSAGQSGPGS